MNNNHLVRMLLPLLLHDAPYAISKRLVNNSLFKHRPRCSPATSRALAASATPLPHPCQWPRRHPCPPTSRAEPGPSTCLRPRPIPSRPEQWQPRQPAPQRSRSPTPLAVAPARSPTLRSRAPRPSQWRRGGRVALA